MRSVVGLVGTLGIVLAVASAAHEVRVAFEGFQPTIARTVGGRPPSSLRLTLQLASLKQEVTVSNQTADVSTGAATNSEYRGEANVFFRDAARRRATMLLNHWFNHSFKS